MLMSFTEGGLVSATSFLKWLLVSVVVVVSMETKEGGQHCCSTVVVVAVRFR